MILADKITELRKKNGWSQEELAGKINVSRQSVSKWESAASVPDLDKILQLSKIFGVSTDYLLKDDMTEVEYADYPDENEPPVRKVSMEEANAFLEIKRVTAKRTALAVFMCIIAPISLIMLGAASEIPAYNISDNLAGGLGMIILLSLVAAAVGIFISCGMKTKDYEYLEKEAIETEYGVSGMVKERMTKYRDTYSKNNIMGACLCVLSVIPLMASSFLAKNDFQVVIGLGIMLFIISIAVPRFVEAGINNASMQKLLEEGDYTKEAKLGSKAAESLGTVYWLVIVAAFLLYSFTTEDWSRSWIIWPVAGVLYGAVTAIYNIVKKK